MRLPHPLLWFLFWFVVALGIGTAVSCGGENDHIEHVREPDARPPVCVDSDATIVVVYLPGDAEPMLVCPGCEPCPLADAGECAPVDAGPSGLLCLGHITAQIPCTYDPKTYPVVGIDYVAEDWCTTTTPGTCTATQAAALCFGLDWGPPISYPACGDVSG